MAGRYARPAAAQVLIPVLVRCSGAAAAGLQISSTLTVRQLFTAVNDRNGIVEGAPSACWIEVAMARGKDGVLVVVPRRLEPLRRPLLSSRRLIRVLRHVVQPLMPPVLIKGITSRLAAAKLASLSVTMARGTRPCCFGSLRSRHSTALINLREWRVSQVDGGTTASERNRPNVRLSRPACRALPRSLVFAHGCSGSPRLICAAAPRHRRAA